MEKNNERKNKILTMSLLWGGLVLVFLIIFFMVRGLTSGKQSDIPDYYYKTAYTGQIERVKDTSKLSVTSQIAGKGASPKLVDKVTVNVDGNVVKQFSDMLAVDNDGKLYIDIRKAAEVTGIEMSKKTTKENGLTYVLKIKDYTLNLSDNIKKIPVTFGIYKFGTDRVKAPFATVVSSNATLVPFDVVRQFLSVRIGYTEKNNTLYLVKPQTAIKYATELVKKKKYTLFIEQGSSVAFDRYIVSKGGAFLGVVDLKQKNVTGIKYSSINITMNSDFTVHENEKQGTVDLNGKIVIPIKYDYHYKIDPDNELYIAKIGAKYGLIKAGGSEIMKVEYGSIGGNSTKYDGEQSLVNTLIFKKYVTVLKDNKWAIYDVTGKQIIPYEFSGIGFSKEFDMKQELTLVVNYKGKDCLVAKKGELYGAISVPDNDVIIPFEYKELYQDVKNKNALTGFKNGKTVLIK